MREEFTGGSSIAACHISLGRAAHGCKTGENDWRIDLGGMVDHDTVYEIACSHSLVYGFSPLVPSEGSLLISLWEYSALVPLPHSLLVMANVTKLL